MSNLSVAHIWHSAKLREKVIIIVGLAYIVLPFDFIPEVILGPLGLLDDGGALLAVLYAVTAAANRQKQSSIHVIKGEESKK